MVDCINGPKSSAQVLPMLSAKSRCKLSNYGSHNSPNPDWVMWLHLANETLADMT